VAEAEVGATTQLAVAKPNTAVGEAVADMRVVMVLPLVEVVQSLGQAVEEEALLAEHPPLMVVIGESM